MSRFLDGPAEGRALCLRRAPVFLRVVQDRDGHLDALDQANDHPTPDETIWVYYRVAGTLSCAFVCMRGSKEARADSGRQEIADYRIYPDQPEREILEDYHQWTQWCQGEYEAQRRGNKP